MVNYYLRLAPMKHVFVSSSDWFTTFMIVYDCCDWSELLLCFYDTCASPIFGLRSKAVGFGSVSKRLFRTDIEFTSGRTMGTRTREQERG